MNPYAYVNGNPVMWVDLSGLIPGPPSFFVGSPMQDSDVTQIPRYRIGSELWELEFEPETGLAPIPNLEHQYDIIEHYMEEQDVTPGEIDDAFVTHGNACDDNSCGPLSIATIIYNLLDETIDPALLLAEFGCLSSEDGGLAPATLADTINENHGDDLIASRYIPRNEPPEGVGTGSAVSQEDYYNWIRENLLGGEWPIVLIGINPNGREKTFTRYASEANGHFVIITGFTSRHEFWSRGTEWQWLRIYDPFNNRTEYYPALDFFGFTDNGRNSVVFVRRR